MFIQRNVCKILIETSHFPGNNMQTTLCMVLMIFKYGKPRDSIYYMYKCKKLKIKIKREFFFFNLTIFHTTVKKTLYCPCTSLTYLRSYPFIGNVKSYAEYTQ